jgi:hypothetical protein
MKVTAGIRKVLAHRSVKDKIAVPLDCRLCPVGLLPVVSELVREGYLRWIDRGNIHHLVAVKNGIRFPVFVDVYQLTAAGVALCDGIRQR